MHPYGPPPGQQVYALRCVRCGNGLELPADLHAVHIDCGYCGQDNMLPDHVIAARARQHHHYAEDHARAQWHADEQARQQAAEAARQRSLVEERKTWNVIGYVLAAMVMLAVGGLMLGYCATRKTSSRANTETPEYLNGTELVEKRLRKLQEEKQCDRVIRQPGRYQESATFNLNLTGGRDCLHILAEAGTSGSLTLRYEGTAPLPSRLPDDARSIDYRLCASETAEYKFSISSWAPFAAAVVECPR
jgi:hypothetical protein